jgi:hypothetical protein
VRSYSMSSTETLGRHAPNSLPTSTPPVNGGPVVDWKCGGWRSAWDRCVYVLYWGLLLADLMESTSCLSSSLPLRVPTKRRSVANQDCGRIVAPKLCVF